jgi:hypothetical protein
MRTLIDDEVLIHIGLPKTGTTWLQLQLFSRPEFGFFAPAQSESDPKKKVKGCAYPLYRDEANRLIEEQDFDPGALRDRFAAISVPDGMRPVISNERLGGNPLSNGFDRKLLCRRIKDVFPNSRILLVIREQRAMVLSNYLQYLKYGGWDSIERYLDPPSDARHPVLSPAFWRYDRLISLYQETFGAERLLVLPYEMLAADPQAFVAAICRFAGLPPARDLPWARKENVRRGAFSSYHLRRMTRINRRSSANAFFPSLIPASIGKVIDRGIKIAVDAAIPAALEDRVLRELEARARIVVPDGYFAASNRCTAELTGLNVKGYGYES